MAETETQNLPAPQNVLDRIPGARQILLLVGVAASVAVGVGVVFWSQGPGYTVLFPGLPLSDAAEVVQALEADDIPFKIGTGGTVLVAVDRRAEARIMLAALGLPGAAGAADVVTGDPGGFGRSEKLERERLHRAREQHLIDTIVTIRPVQSAKVHLAIPETSPFSRNRRPASASVLLQLHPGRDLTQQQVSAISHLVASSTPNLEAAHVTIVDQNGRLLTNGAGGDEMAMSETQFEAARDMERQLTAKVEKLLTPIVGRGRVRAEVAVVLDFTLIEETRESYDPDTVMISEHVEERRLVGETGPEGVPGALSNQPPQALAAVTEGQEKAQQPITTSMVRRRNNEAGKSIRHVKQPLGSIQRLSVAVVLDNRPAAGKGKKAESTPLSDAELEQITELVKHAVGFDETRGDTLNVLNVPFIPEPKLTPPKALPLWKQPWLLALGKQLLGVVLLLALVVTIVRPLMRSLTQPPPRAALLIGEGQAGLPLGADQVSLSGRATGTLAGYDNPLAAARGMAGQDPKRVAQVGKGWVADDG